MTKNQDEKIEVENINVPGHIAKVDLAKYMAMKEAMLATLTDQKPGMTAKEAIESLKPHLDAELFPGGSKAGWWQKTVQLDLEAKGIIARSNSKPLRFYIANE